MARKPKWKRDQQASNPPSEAQRRRNAEAVERLRPFQWKPGQSGNPECKNLKGPSMARLLFRALESDDPENPGFTYAHRLVGEWLGIALGDGDDAATKLRAILAVIDRTDGRPTEKVEVSGLTARDVIAEMREAAERHERDNPGGGGIPGGADEVPG